MLQIYKDWYINADEYQYIVGKVITRTRGDKTTLEFKRPVYSSTIAAAVNYILEAETREKVADSSLIDLKEAFAYYSNIADELLAAIDRIPGNLRKAVEKRECDD